MVGIGIGFLLLVGLLVLIYFRVHKEKREIQNIQQETILHTTHQIRSPITAVRGYSSLILDEEYGQLPDELRKPIDIIRRSGEHLAVLIEEYREFSGLEHGELELECDDTDIAELMREIIEEMEVLAKADDQSLYFKVESEIPHVLVDRGRIRQVAHNIIENSIAYTPAGTDIYVELEVKEKKILITISDTGPGIPDDEVDFIFEKYKRGKRGKNAGNGTGLGLYIARALVRFHGGDIYATRSKQYGGAAFQIEIPIL